MLSEAYFENVTWAGNLFLEHIFYEFEGEPIVFTCVNEDGSTFLCLCSEIRYGQKWIISPCSTEILWDLVGERTDIASAFRRSDFLIVVQMDLQGQERSRVIDTGSVDELDLPKEGLLLRCDKDAACRYLHGKLRDTARTSSYSVSINAQLTVNVELYRERQWIFALAGRLLEYGRLLKTLQSYNANRRTEYTGLLDMNEGDEDVFLMAA